MCNLFVLRHVQFCCETTIWTWTGLNESFSERGYRGYFTNSVCNVEWEVQMENIQTLCFYYYYYSNYQARAQTFWGAGAQTKKRAPIAKIINEIKNNNNK